MKIFFKSTRRAIDKFLKKMLIGRIFLILIILTLLGIWQIKIPAKTVLSANQPVTSAGAYQDFHLLIPRINVNAPVIADVDGSDKDIYFNTLQEGVAHFKGTAKPGEGSNIFIFGHSSFYAWDPGKYKKVFLKLEELEIGDEIILWHNQKEYQYKISKIIIIEPDQVDVLKPTPTEQLTLMTCVPPGTALKRLIVVGKPAP